MFPHTIRLLRLLFLIALLGSISFHLQLPLSVYDASIGLFLYSQICFIPGCDINASRRPGLNGEGGEEAFDGQGPLHMAAQWGQENVVTCLIGMLSSFSN